MRGVPAAGDRRGRAGPRGGRLSALEEPREQKETATAPPWSKQPALAAAQGRAADSEPSALTPSPPLPPSCAWQEAAGADPPPGAGEVRARWDSWPRPDAGGTGPRHAALPAALSSPLPRASSRPAPFPTWIPGRLANSPLREAGSGGDGSDPSAPADVFTPHLPCS
nr:translation initiation factor IF-2-like [Saimiri boliviensis boliviensis]